MNRKLLVAALLTVSLSGWMAVRAEDAKEAKKEAPAAEAPVTPPAVEQAKPEAGGAYKKQADAASATATFATVSKTNEAYTTALEAHDLDGAKGKVGSAGAFKGTVSGLFERPGFLIVNFDKNYKTALSAVVRSKSFGAFPNLQTIVGKEVVVSGTFSLHQERPQIQLSTADQIKIAE